MIRNLTILASLVLSALASAEDRLPGIRFSASFTYVSTTWPVTYNSVGHAYHSGDDLSFDVFSDGYSGMDSIFLNHDVEKGITRENHLVIDRKSDDRYLSLDRYKFAYLNQAKPLSDLRTFLIRNNLEATHITRVPGLIDSYVNGDNRLELQEDELRSLERDFNLADMHVAVVFAHSAVERTLPASRNIWSTATYQGVIAQDSCILSSKVDLGKALAEEIGIIEQLLSDGDKATAEKLRKLFGDRLNHLKKTFSYTTQYRYDSERGKEHKCVEKFGRFTWGDSALEDFLQYIHEDLHKTRDWAGELAQAIRDERVRIKEVD